MSKSNEGNKFDVSVSDEVVERIFDGTADIKTIDPEPEEIEVQDELDEEKEPEHRTALVLFSGGFDSVAVALKIIKSEEYKEIVLLYENVTVFDEYEQGSRDIYELLKPIAKEHGASLVFDTENINMDWIENPSQDYPEGERDLCLMVHLTTLFSKGEYDSIYLGWNRSNIDTLKESSVLLSYLERYSKSSRNIYFLEHFFLEDYESEVGMMAKAHITKRRVVKYLLNNKLFEYCTSQGTPNEEDHWYDAGAKWKEVLIALVDLTFTQKELATILRNNSLSTVQRVWNRNVKKALKK